MPFSGYTNSFSFRNLFLLFSLCVASIIVFGLANPNSALADFRLTNGQCRFYYGNTSGQEQSLPVAMSFCTGGSGGGNGACAALDNCYSVSVPGVPGCSNPPGTPKATYVFPNNDQSQPPTGINFDMGCSATWSTYKDSGGHEVPSKDIDMNIVYFSINNKNYTDFRPGNLGNQRDYKVQNNSQTKYIPLSIMNTEMQDYSVSHDFKFYPNCAGSLEDAESADCFRKASIPALVIDNNRPTCSVSSVANGSNYDVTITGNDVGSGVAQMQLSYQQIDGAGNPIGTPTPIMTPFRFSPVTANSSQTQTFQIPKSSLTSGNGYIAVAEVWDLKGRNNYDTGADDSANSVTCTTQLQCVMPTPAIQQLYACTPNPIVTLQGSQARAINLNLGGAYCGVDYVNVSHSNNFTYGNYYRNYSALYAGTTSMDIPHQMINPANNTYLYLQPGKPEYIMYYDAQSQQTSVVRSWTPPVQCTTPGTPTFTAFPICKRNSSDADTSKASLSWNAPANPGQGTALSYDLQIDDNSTFNSPIYTTSVTRAAPQNGPVDWDLGIYPPNASYKVGGMYYYRIRARNWGGYSNWVYSSSNGLQPAQGYLLNTTPSAATNFNTSALNARGTSIPAQVNLSWRENFSALPGLPQYNAVQQTDGWVITRTPIGGAGSSRTFFTDKGEITATDSTNLTCNDTTYRYSLYGRNTCGNGPGVFDDVTCPRNTGPTCGAIQYRDTPNGAWNNWPAAGLTEDPGTNIQVRRTCTDPEVNNVIYSWTASAGSITPNPTTLASGTTYMGDFTFPNVANSSNNLTSNARDTGGAQSPQNPTTVVAKTWPTVSFGTHTITPGSRTIQRSSTSDAYAVVGGVTQNIGYVNYNIVGYSNPLLQGAFLNREGILTINTSAVSAGNMLNICNSTYGSCSFTANGTTRMANITAANSSYQIQVSFNAAQALAVKEVMADPANTGSRFGIHVDFNTTDAKNIPISTGATGNAPITNNAPFCQNITFSPSPAGPGGTMTITPTIRDDWGLGDLTVYYSTPANPTSFQRIFDTSGDYFDNLGNPRGASPAITWNLSALTGTNRYNIRVNFTDQDGKTTTCYANDADAGSGIDNPGGGPTTLPVVTIDKTVPACTSGITITRLGDYIAFGVNGQDPRSNNTYSGLNQLSFTYRRTNNTPMPSPLAAGSPIAIAGSPQTYSFPVPSAPYNASTPGTLNIGSMPSGTYNIVATWRDRAGNTGSCNANYDKGSLISGRVKLTVDTNGNKIEDFKTIPGTSTDFVIRTNNGANTIVTDWINSGTDCVGSYPGRAYPTDTCNAYFVSNNEFSATSPARDVSLTVGTMSGALSAVGRYSCTINIRTAGETGPIVRTVQSDGANGVCTATLLPTEIAMGTVANGPATLWPTHVEFILHPNTDQIAGRVWDSNGNIVSQYLATALRDPSGAAWGSSVNTVPAFTVPPTQFPDDSAIYVPNVGAYVRGGVHIQDNRANPNQRLCVWAMKNDMTTYKDLASFTSIFNSAANIGTIVRSQSVPSTLIPGNDDTGWTVDTANVTVNSCDIMFPLKRNGNMSPKYQHQVHVMSVPKVNITGKVYLVNDSSLCTADEATLADPSSQVPGNPTVPVRVTYTPTAAAPGAPTSATFTGLAAQYDNRNGNNNINVFVGGLPDSNFNQWQYTRGVSFVNASDGNMYTTCPNSTVDVGGNLGTGAGAPASPYPLRNQVTNNVIVYAKGANNWWQVYNGGVHALNKIEDEVPDVIAVGEGGSENAEIHMIVGNPTYSMFDPTGVAPVLSIRNKMRQFNSGGLVSTASTDPIGGVGVIPGLHRTGSGAISQNWGVASTKFGELRLPYRVAEDSTTLTVIDKIGALNSLPTHWGDAGDFDSNQKVYINGDYKVENGSPLKINGFQYVVIKGNLTIEDNIVPTSSDPNFNQTILMVATGDVTISGAVSEINAMIYTPGNITINSAGQNSSNEKVLKVYGGLYAGKNVTMHRDLQNSVANFGYPAVQVIYNPALIINSTGPGFPSELKESNVYWINQ